GSGWHKKGSTLNLAAPEVSGFRFAMWLVNGSAIEQNFIAVTIDSPKKIVAVYEKIEETNKTLRVSTTPEGLLIKLDSKQTVSPYEISAAEGTSHSFSVISPQEKDLSNLVTGTDVRYVFSSWNDGITSVNRTVKLDSDFSFTANMNKELKVETSTQPVGVVQISGSGWYSEGSSITLKASSVAGYNFMYWVINGINTGDSSSLDYVVSEPLSVKAVYNSIPVVSFEDISIIKGDTLRLTLSDYASDKDGDTLEYSLVSGPGSISDGTYTVDSSLISYGKHDISIRVSDGRGGSVTGKFVLTVTEENNAPTAPNTPFPVSGSVDQELSVTLSWECLDPDGDALVYDVYFGTSSSPVNVASGISSNAWQTGELTEGATYYWKVVAKDSKGATSESPLWSFITRNSVPADGVDKVGPVYTGDVLLVSNESESGTSRAFTGTLSEDFLPTSFTNSDSLEMEAFMVNPEIPLPYDALPENISVPRDTFELSSIGDTREFWVLNFVTNKYYQLAATLLYIGQYSEVWVESTTVITESRAAELGSEFDNAIYPLVAEYFYTPSDVDGNGRVQILCFDIQDNFATTGAYVGGYFSSGDLFNISNSNRAEIFYIDTYPTMYYPKDKPVDVSRAYSTLAHEFQHMVNFNRNYLVEGGDPMPSWINEGLSMAAEHLYSGVLTRRISYYNSSTNIQNGHSLVYWGDNNDTLSNYALSYLFLQYIRAQVGTESVYKDMLLDKNNGSGAITNAFAKYGTVKTLGEIMTDFRLALHLKNPSGPYGFMGDSDFDGITERLYTGSAKELRGGSAIFKTISDSYTEPGDQGSTIQYAGITG
ncbi:MAG: InlB B-repeat-containing protein, partial [Kosmotogaceae bacterium]